MTTKTTDKPKAPIKNIVLETLKILEDFTILLMRETEALHKKDFQTIDNLQTDKRNFARDYHVLVLALTERKSEIETLDINLREKIVRARTKFTHTLTENTQALELMQSSAQRLIDRILEVARMSVRDETQTGYSVKGSVETYKTATLSLKLDQTL